MRVLIIKTSSMGDILHTVPALHDAREAHPEVHFDWLIEQAYVPLVDKHPFVHKCIPIQLRSHKGNFLSYLRSPAYKTLRRKLKLTSYDFVIDAQSLLKSAWFTRLAQGERCGYTWATCREPFASLAYQKICDISLQEHAITRTRQLFAQSLNYTYLDHPPTYHLKTTQKECTSPLNIIFFPGTTWRSKMWPIQHWVNLGQQLASHGYHIHIAWGSAEEKQCAETIASNITHAVATPDLSMIGMKDYLNNIQAYVAVDTGFAHLAAAMDIPGVCLMGPTSPMHSGPQGAHQVPLTLTRACSPCRKRHCQFVDKNDDSLCLSTIQASDVCVKLRSILNTYKEQHDNSTLLCT